MNVPRLHPRVNRIRASALSLALLAALPCAAQSLRVDYEVGASFLHSDNINLSDTNPDSDSILSPSISFAASQTGSTTRLRARGLFQYLDYRDHTYSDEFRGEFAGQFGWTLLPERLEFVVEDYLGRQPVNVLDGFSPGNQQQINVFTTGPSLYARFGDAMRGQVDLRYSNTYAEETKQFNGNRYNVAGRLFRDLDPTQRLSMNLEVTQVRFDTALPGADYTRYDGYLGYRRESAKVDLDAAVGYTRIERDGIAGNESLPLVRARLGWKVTPRSTIDIDASYQFADTASDLVSENSGFYTLGIEDLPSPTLLVSPRVYEELRYEVGYSFDGERLDFQIQPYVDQIQYPDIALDGWKSRGAYGTLRYRLRPRQNFLLLAMTERRDYANSLRIDDDYTLRIAYEYRFNRHLSGTLAWQRRNRNSSAPGQDYSENMTALGFVYRR